MLLVLFVSSSLCHGPFNPYVNMRGTALAEEFLANYHDLKTREERYEAVIFVLTELAQIIDKTATTSELEYEVGDRLRRALNSVDSRDREMKRRFFTLEEEAKGMKEQIDELINVTRRDLVELTRNLRTEILGSIGAVVRESISKQQITAKDLKKRAGAKVGEMKTVSGIQMLLYFAVFQVIIVLCVYLSWKFAKEAI
jgi:hypothetical protein